MTSAKQSQLLVTVWDPFIPFLLTGRPLFCCSSFDRPQGQRWSTSLKMGRINFSGSGHLCVWGVQVRPRKVINYSPVRASSIGAVGEWGMCTWTYTDLWTGLESWLKEKRWVRFLRNCSAFIETLTESEFCENHKATIFQH